MSKHNDIKKVTARIERLVEALIGVSHMVRGSYSIVHLRCGKATCWCAKSEQNGHVCTRITWTENGTSRTKTIKEEDRERLRKAVETYRMYRQKRRQLRTQEKLLEELLNKHEQEIANNPDKI